MSVAQRTGLALMAVLLLAGAAFAHATRGFRAITSDGVRRIDLANTPRSLPPVMLIDSNRRTWRLSDLGASGKATLVALIYTHCATICSVSASGQNFLQNEIRSRGLGNQVQLLSISFDPARDTPDALAAYAHRQRVDPDLWTVATVARRSDLSAMLAAFGVVVLPDPWGGYSHNAALFFVDQRGWLAYAYDVDRPDNALADLLEQRRTQDDLPSH
jgi:protein SCO1/2